MARKTDAARERDDADRLQRHLAQLGPLMRGSLVRSRGTCGKPNCRCTRGQPHEGLYLVVTEGGKPRQLYVPKSWEQTVRDWIEQYRQARRLMDELSRIHWDKVRHRQG